MLEIVLTGRNDGYGGEDFTERMFTAAEFNHRVLTEAGVAHRFTLVEWNPPEHRGLVADLVRARLPFWNDCLVVSRDWHHRTSTNPRLQFMEFFAKNVAIRRSQADWILTTNSDIFLSQQVVEALASGLVPGTLYRATRVDVDRTINWRQPSWELFANRETWLREHTLRPPYFTEAAGDFLLLHRDSWNRTRGFNEIVRFAKIYKDGQFCIQGAFHGMPVTSLGRIYHLDHDGSYATALEKWGPKHELAPFGPWWDANHAYANRSDWGLSAAVEVPDSDRGCIWLRTPEESGPELSIVVPGDADGEATSAAVERLREAHESVEVIVARRTSPGEPWTTSLNAAIASAHGRLLMWLAQPAYFTAADLLTIIETFATNPSVDALACGEQWVDGGGNAIGAVVPPNEAAPVAVVRRAVYDALGDLDVMSTAPLVDYWRRTAEAFAVRDLPSVACRIPIQAAAGLNARVQQTVVSDETLSSYRRLSISTATEIATKLRALVPAGTRSVAIRGVDFATPLVIAAARAEGLVVSHVYADDEATVGDRCGGVVVSRWSDRRVDDTFVIVLERAAPGQLSIAPHLFERSVNAAPVDPHMLPLDGVAAARRLRSDGHHEASLTAFLTLVQPGAAGAGLLLEAGEAAESASQLEMAVALYRQLLRIAPQSWLAEKAQLIDYRLGSLWKRLGKPSRALRFLRRALRSAVQEPRLTGAAHFHCGELLREQGRLAEARTHYELTRQYIPNHQRAVERLAELPDGQRDHVLLVQ
jgi:hypothetical protein